MITTMLIIQCVALLLLLLCSAFFSSAETCLFSLNSLQVGRIRRQNAKAAERIEAMLDNPTRLLSTILIGNTIVNVAAASLGFTVLAALEIKYTEAIAIPTMTVLLLIFGEVAPKRLAMKRAAELAAL